MLLGEETWDRPEPRPRSHKREDDCDPLLVAAFLIGLPFSKIEMGYRSLPTQACILSHHHTAKMCGKVEAKTSRNPRK